MSHSPELAGAAAAGHPSGHPEVVPALARDDVAGKPGALARGLRLRQWTKNLVLFAGILFAAKLGDALRWLEACSVFVVYCFASSAAYLVNDVCDAARDRLHPRKRRRPLASGLISRAQALLLAGTLLVLGLALAAALGRATLALLAAFVALQAAYSFFLKRVAVLDVLTIAALFVLRAAAGAEAVRVRISPWLLTCTALLALFLALAKRRAELLLVRGDPTPVRPALVRYSLASLDRSLVALAAATLIAYSLYTVTAHDSPELVSTVPFVLYAVARYLILIQRQGIGEEPERVLLSDVPILSAVAAWALSCGLILTLS